MNEIDPELFDSSYVSAKFENSIMIGTYKKNIAIDITLAKQIVKERLVLFGGKSFPVLVDARQIRLVTKEASRYFAREGTEGITALGIVVGNYLSVVTGNLFMKFSRKRVPTKLFKTKEHALRWLGQFVGS